MNLHQLTVFKAVVETGSFCKAAQKLRLAQSAVSYHVRLLEVAVGEPLFHRTKSGVAVTEKGKKLWRHAERISAAVDEAERDMFGASTGGELRLGLGVSSLSGQLPAFVKHLTEIFPSVTVHVVMGATPEIVEQLRAGRADMGVVSLPIQDRDLETIVLFYEEEQMVVVTCKNSPFARKSEIGAAELARIPLILYNQSTTTRTSLDSFFREAGVSPRILMEVDREDAIMSLVKSGLGATILPLCVPNLAEHKADLHFLRLRDAFLRREVGVALVKSAPRAPLLGVATRLCQEHFRPAHLPGPHRELAPGGTSKGRRTNGGGIR